LISGLGLSLWLIRALLRRGLAPVLAVALGLTVGVSLMWNLQRWLVDRIVAQASLQDKRMSLYAQQLSPALLGGQIKIRGRALVDLDLMPADSRPVWRALLPAITLGLAPEDIQAGVLQAAMQSRAWPERLLTDAYRRAVMVPIALGVSLMLGLANLCLLLSLLVQRLWPGRASQTWRQLGIFLLLWISVLSWSLNAHAAQTLGGAYTETTRPLLRANQPVLAPFVEWSLRAQPTWQGPTGWMHDHLMAAYGFHRLPGLD
jgi:hypothetical protein